MCRIIAHHPYYICTRNKKIYNNQNINAMNQSIVLTPHVINTINSLPTEERVAIASAIAGEIILGGSVTNELTAQQALLYTVIKDYIRRDSARASA